MGPATAHASALLRGVAWELNHHIPELQLKCPKQCMCACYQGDGAHYVAHRDNVCSGAEGSEDSTDDCHNSREVTAILYTSIDWKEEDGGCLRYWPHGEEVNGSDDGDGLHEDVAPEAGTLVIFRSKTVLHEVLPSYAPRIALSLWLLSPTS